MKLLTSAALALALALNSLAASAAQETTTSLTHNIRIVETTNILAKQLKDVLTPDIGFPETYLEHWHDAVDAAFKPDLIEADYIKALEGLLSPQTRAAGLAFEESELGRKIFELDMDTAPLEADTSHLEQARQRLDAGSVADNGLFVDLFEMLDGPDRTGAIMDLYFSAMVTAATPVIGAEAAAQWVSGAQKLSDGYTEDYFLTTVAVYGQLPEDELKLLVETLATPAMSAHTDQVTQAFSEALAAAATRLDKAYTDRISGS